MSEDSNKNDIEYDDRGRPAIVFDWKTLNAVLKFGANKKDAAEVLECSVDTIERRIKEKYNMTFTQYKKQKMAYMRMRILNKQYEVAMNGNVSMLIWLGKQHCDQTDKRELDLFNGDDKENSMKIEFVDAISKDDEETE